MRPEVDPRIRCWFEPWTYMHVGWRLPHFSGFPYEAFVSLNDMSKRRFYASWCRRLKLQVNAPPWLLSDNPTVLWNMFRPNQLEAVAHHIGAVAWASHPVFQSQWLQNSSRLLGIVPIQQWRHAIQFAKLKPIHALAPAATPAPIPDGMGLLHTGLVCLRLALEPSWPGIWPRLRLCLDAQSIADADLAMHASPITLNSRDQANVLFAMRSVVQHPGD